MSLLEGLAQGFMQGQQFKQMQARQQLQDKLAKIQGQQLELQLKLAAEKSSAVDRIAGQVGPAMPPMQQEGPAPQQRFTQLEGADPGGTSSPHGAIPARGLSDVLADSANSGDVLKAMGGDLSKYMEMQDKVQLRQLRDRYTGGGTGGAPGGGPGNLALKSLNLGTGNVTLGLNTPGVPFDYGGYQIVLDKLGSLAAQPVPVHDWVSVPVKNVDGSEGVQWVDRNAQGRLPISDILAQFGQPPQGAPGSAQGAVSTPGGAVPAPAPAAAPGGAPVSQGPRLRGMQTQPSAQALLDNTPVGFEHSQDLQLVDPEKNTLQQVPVGSMTMGELREKQQEGRVVHMSPAQKTQVNTVQTALRSINELRAMAEQLFKAGPGAMARFAEALKFGKADLLHDVALVPLYNVMRKGFAPNVGRALGQSGAFSDNDQRQAERLFASLRTWPWGLPDADTVAMMKFDVLDRLMKGRINDIVGVPLYPDVQIPDYAELEAAAGAGEGVLDEAIEVATEAEEGVMNEASKFGGAAVERARERMEDARSRWGTR